MTAETSNARGEWPERYACNGPEGTFWTDDAALANKLIGAAFDRDEWTVTDTQNPTGAAPSSTAETIHTCSYYCERPGCIRAQRDELRDRMEAALAQQPAAVDEAMAERVLAPDVSRLVEAARNLRRRQRAYLEQPKGERDESKGRLVGDAARELDEALAPFTAALAPQQPAAPPQPAGRVHDLAARLVDELDGLVGESYGVSGLHLNGDVAPWDELLPGGRFERLSSLDELRAALAAQQQGGAE